MSETEPKKAKKKEKKEKKEKKDGTLTKKKKSKDKDVDDSTASSTVAAPAVGVSAPDVPPAPPLSESISVSNSIHASENDERHRLLVAHKMTQPLSLADFLPVRTIGTGSFGRVMVARYNATGRYYALKLQKKSEIVRLKQVQHVKDEKSILTSISHPYIVNLLAAFQDASRIVLVLEFVTGGEMFTFLRRARRFDNERAKLYTAQIVSAFDYLHARNIIYRDLKPENLLFAGNGSVKVTDFGFAKVVPDKTYTVCGTPEYIAPEIIRSQGHSAGADWWAVGILMYEMLVGYPPYFADNPFGIYEKILSNAPIPFPPTVDKEAKDLIKNLLQHDLTKRFGCMRSGADDIKQHKWFKGIDWHAIENGTHPPLWLPPQEKDGEAANFDKYQEEKLKIDTGDDPYKKLFADF